MIVDWIAEAINEIARFDEHWSDVAQVIRRHLPFKGGGRLHAGTEV